MRRLRPQEWGIYLADEPVYRHAAGVLVAEKGIGTPLSFPRANTGAIVTFSDLKHAY
jgi:hypothetical protein